MTEEESALKRELAKAEMKMEEALEKCAAAEEEYAAWDKEKSNILKALYKFSSRKRKKNNRT